MTVLLVSSHSLLVGLWRVSSNLVYPAHTRLENGGVGEAKTSKNNVRVEDKGIANKIEKKDRTGVEK